MMNDNVFSFVFDHLCFVFKRPRTQERCYSIIFHLKNVLVTGEGCREYYNPLKPQRQAGGVSIYY